MILEIPGKLPSLNALKNGWARHNWRKRFERAIPPLVKSKRAKSPRGLRIYRILGPRERLYDLDNLTGGAKPLIDALVRLGYLKGDTPALLTSLMVSQSLDREPEGPWIQIEFV